MGAKDSDRLPEVSCFYAVLWEGCNTSKHRPEVFLSAAFLKHTTGSFCPRLCRVRGTAGAAGGDYRRRGFGA